MHHPIGTMNDTEPFQILVLPSLVCDSRRISWTFNMANGQYYAIMITQCNGSIAVFEAYLMVAVELSVSFSHPKHVNTAMVAPGKTHRM